MPHRQQVLGTAPALSDLCRRGFFLKSKILQQLKKLFAAEPSRIKAAVLPYCTKALGMLGRATDIAHGPIGKAAFGDWVKGKQRYFTMTIILLYALESSLHLLQGTFEDLGKTA